MSIIKFKKEHQAGIPKGAVKELSDKSAERLIDEGYAEESTQEELDSYREKLAKRKKPDYQKEAVENANKTNTDCKECGNNPDCKDCKEKAKKGDDKKYHVLTQEDIDANLEAAFGLEVGDEVEINQNDELLLDDAGLLKAKKSGNE